MSKFVKCLSFTDGCETLVALNSVKTVHRENKVERASVIETYTGKWYECYSGDGNAAPCIADCIVEI